MFGGSGWRRCGGGSRVSPIGVPENDVSQLPHTPCGGPNAVLRSAAADLIGLRPFRRGSLKQTQRKCAHVSAVICGEVVEEAAEEAEGEAEEEADEEAAAEDAAETKRHIFAKEIVNFKFSL